MASPFNLKQIITNFQANYCTWVTAEKSGCQYPQVEIPKRKELITILVLKIKDCGKPKEFFTNSTRDEIVKEIIPPKESGLKPKTINGFKVCTRKMLDWVIELCYNEKSNITLKDAEGAVQESNKVDENKKSISIKLFDPDKFKNREDKEPPVEDILDEEMAELLGLNKKDE